MIRQIETKRFNSQKGLAPIIAIFILAVILIGGGAYYFNQQTKPVSKSTEINKTTSWDNVPKNFFYTDSLIEKELNQCSSDNSSTLGMSDCYGVAIKKYDAILDRAYELTLQDLAEARIVDARRFFTQYKDNICGIAYDEAQGGSIRVLLGDSCSLHVIRTQIQTLCSLGSGPSRCEGKIQF